jgi:hypothetical protein
VEQKFYDTRDPAEDAAALLGTFRALIDFVESEGLAEEFSKYLAKHSNELGARVDDGRLQIAEVPESPR